MLSMMDDSWPRRSGVAEIDLGPTDTVDTSVDRVLSMLARRLGLGLWMVTRAGGETTAIRTVDGTERREVSREVLDWAESFGAAAMVDAQPVVAPDVAAVPELDALAAAGEFVVGSFIGVPLRDDSGEALGALCGIGPEPLDSSAVADLELVEVLGHLLGSLLGLQQASDQARLQVLEAVEQRHRDALTGVLNRSGWDEAMEREAMRCRSLDQAASVVVIDLDDLKEMNDRYGHAYGDEQIRVLAHCLTSAARADDVVARLGGDEFGLLAPGSAPGTAEELAARLRQRVDHSSLAASIGAAECPPGGDLQEAWRRADLEMYASKRLRHAQDRPPSETPPEPTSGFGDEVEAMMAAACTLATTPLRVLRRVTSSQDPGR